MSAGVRTEVMWAFLSLILAASILILIFLFPVLGFWSFPTGIFLAWLIKKFLINPNDPLQPTYKPKRKHNQTSKEFDEINNYKQSSFQNFKVPSINAKDIAALGPLPKFGIFVCIIALLPWPTEFYIFTRICLFSVAGLLARQLYKSKPDDQQGWWILLIACAVLYNPIFPIYLNSRLGWMIINVLTALLFFHSSKLITEYNKKSKSPWSQLS